MENADIPVCQNAGYLIRKWCAITQIDGYCERCIIEPDLADIMGNVKVNVKEGAGLTLSLAKRGFLPEIAVHLLKVGEETGNLDQMLF